MNLHAAMAFFHIIFAAVWTGSVVFVTWGVLPVARTGSVGAGPLEAIVTRLRTLSRVSAVVLLVSGGLLAGSYGAAMMQTTAGYLVLGMIVLWLLLIGFIEMAAKTVLDVLRQSNSDQAIAKSAGRFRAAGIVAVLLLVDAGLLAAF